MRAHRETSQPERPHTLAISDPIPASALAWDPSITRPTTLPEKYDERIPVTSIYYIPSTKQYVVADRCTKCQTIQQACNRALPSCSRCAPTGEVCTPCSNKYVRLPPPKQVRPSLLSRDRSLAIELDERKSSRPNRKCARNPDITKAKLLARHATKSLRSRPTSKKKERVNEKVLRTPQNVLQTSAEAREGDPVENPSTLLGTLTPPEPSRVDQISRPRGRRGPEGADYYVPDAVTPTWKHITPPKNSNKPTLAPKLEFKTFPFSSKVSRPAIWAETREDLLRALPTHPSIMAQHGLGYYGELPEVLILEGPKWDRDKWMGLGTFNLTRKWNYTWEVSNTPSKSQAPENSIAPPTMEANDNTSDGTHNPDTTNKYDQFDSICEHFRRILACPICSPNLPDVFSRDYVRLSPLEPELPHLSDEESLNDSDSSEPKLCSLSDDEGSSSGASSCGPVTPHHAHVRTLDESYRDGTTKNVFSDLSSMSIWDPGEYYEVVGFVPPQSSNSVSHDPAINAAEVQTSVSQDTQIHANIAVERIPDCLPPEAGLLKNTHDTRDPIRLIVSRDSQLFPFPLPENCAYAFLGFFYITALETTAMPNDDTNSSGTVDIRLTLQWAGDQLFESMSAPRPWWRPSFASSPLHDFSPIPDDSDEIELMSYQLLEGIMSYPLPRSMSLFHIPPAWHCIECGRLNTVTPFRTRWSWSCRSCGMIARDDDFPTVDPEAVCDPLPALPIPVDSTHAIHTRSVASTGEEMVAHVFRNSNAFVQHVLPPGYSLIQANKVFVDLQKEGNFMRVDLASGNMSHLSYKVPSCGQMLRSPRPIQETWRWVEQHVHRRPGLLEKCKRSARELKEMHCFAFTSKGSLKGQSIEPGHMLFCALGASLTVKLSTFDRDGTLRTIDLAMAHGDRVFVDSVDKEMTYVVRRTGPSCLLAARWVSPVREKVDLGKILERTT